jgi:hypothetical protein
MENLIKKIIWFLVLFSSFEGFGLRAQSWGGLGLSPIGWFGILQLLTILIAILYPFIYKTNYFNRKGLLGTPILLVYLLIVIIVIQSLIQSILFHVFPLEEIIRNLIKIRYVFFYFLFVSLMRTERDIKISLQVIVFSSLVSVIIAFIFIIFNIDAVSIVKSTSNYAGKEFRVIMPTGILISFAYFYSLSNLRTKYKLNYLLLMLFSFLGILIQLHRNVIISLFLVSLFAFMVIFGLKFKRIISSLFVIGILILGVYFVFKMISYRPDLILNNYLQTKQEILSNEGNFGVRTYLVVNSIDYVYENYFILGVGLNWERMTDYKDYIYYRFLAGPNLDSGYHNIIIIYGLLGILVYLFLFYRIIMVNIRNILSKKKDIYLSHTILFSFIYILLTAISQDNFMLYSSTIIFIYIIAVSYVIEIKQFNLL